MDSSRKLYKALGYRKMNLFKIWKFGKSTEARIKSRNIPGSAWGNGEGLILGGILIFDAHGQIRGAFEEKSAGQEFPFDQIKIVLDTIINE